MVELTSLDLFSGIGGMTLGLQRAGIKTIAFCENNTFCQKVLNKNWPHIPIYKDIRTIRGEFNGTVDIITGGYPCQPFSIAGKRQGAADDRHLWPEMYECIKHYQPTWVIAENVVGHVHMGLDNVLADLESEAYTAQTFIIPACAVNAPHRRDRVWIVAYSERNAEKQARSRGEDGRRKQTTLHEERQEGDRQTVQRSGCNTLSDTTTNTHNERCKGGKSKKILWESTLQEQLKGSFEGWVRGWDLSRPMLCRMDDGLPNRAHRLRALGNAVVPQIPEIIGRFIIEATKGIYEDNNA